MGEALDCSSIAPLLFLYCSSSPIGTGGELERLPGKVGGALVDQGRCKPVAWERPSIVPLLLLYYSSIVPLVLAVYFPATPVPASTGVQCRRRDSGWVC